MSKHKPEDLNCENCAFWEDEDEPGLKGTCRKAAPKMGWPLTKSRDWCGEFLPDGLEAFLGLVTINPKKWKS